MREDAGAGRASSDTIQGTKEDWCDWWSWENGMDMMEAKDTVFLVYKNMWWFSL
jgi:hypothetical protein